MILLQSESIPLGKRSAGQLAFDGMACMNLMVANSVLIQDGHRKRPSESRIFFNYNIMDYKIYIVSFGGSDEYSVSFNGSIEQLRDSKEFRRIIDDLKDCLDNDFPAGNYSGLISPKIREANDTDKDYPALDSEAIRHIKLRLKREGEVLIDNKKLDRNAPFDDIKAEP